jgi:hypothetical protein
VKLKRLVSELSLEKLGLKCFPALHGCDVLRFSVTLICLGFATCNHAQSVQLPDAPEPSASLLCSNTSLSDSSSTANLTGPLDFAFSLDLLQTGQSTPGTIIGSNSTMSFSRPIRIELNPDLRT